MAEPTPLLLVDYVILALCVLFGATFGSFFNVVIYRLPRGKNIAYPPSSCPKCARPIRMRHNIPVLGWLLLRGKCYDCEAPISARYPLVEAITALTFGLLAWLEPLHMGMNLPTPPEGMSALLPILTDLWWLAGLHAILLAGLLIAAGIDYDGLRVPTTLAVLLVFVAIGAIFAVPALLPVPAFAELVKRWPLSAIAVSGASSVYGAIVGMVFGCVISPGTGVGRSGDAGRYNGLIVLTWIGAVLGAQAVGTIAAVCMLAYQFAMMYRFGITRLQHVTFPGLVWLATFAWIINWKWIAANPWFPLDSRATWQVLVWQATIAVVAAAVTYWFRGPQHLAAQPPVTES
ncbi:MAG: prepilin peptidase [Planctomycetaceae bacterium]|nr:prepilin peptidase [Planctomycetaceae bacterium]